MKRRYFFPLLVAGLMFLYIGPVNLALTSIPLAIPTEKNMLSDDPVIGEKILLERGSQIYLGSGQYSFSTMLGEYNTFNGSHYVPYLYDDITHNATFAGHSIVLYDWYATFSNTTQTLIDDMRWVVQYWQDQAGGRWAELDLWDHSFLPAVEGSDTLTFGQRYTDGGSVLDVYYMIHNYDQVKILLNFTAASTEIYRFVWKFTGVDGELVEYEKHVSFDDVGIGWSDTELNATYEWTVETKKCDITFDNLTINADETYTLDPSVHPTLGADSDDDYWYWHNTNKYYYDHRTAYTTAYCTNSTSVSYSRIYQVRFSLDVPQSSTIDEANISIYENLDSGSNDGVIYRINEADVGSLEGDTVKPIISNTTTEVYDWDSSAGAYKTNDVTDLVQEQINLGGWAATQYMGFDIRIITATDAATHRVADYQGGANHAYMDITYSAGGNNDPVNDQTPTLDNADDTDNMYAAYREYKITVYVSDADGYADIDYLEVSLWDNAQSTEYFRFRYDEDTDTFTEEYDSGTVVSLNTGSSTATESGNDIDAQFWFTIDWDHADLTDIDTECYVVDDEPASDTDFYEANFDVETRLDYSVAPSVTGDDSGTVDRGDLDESFTIGGTLIYYGSGDDNPASDQIDVWISASEYGSTVGPWSDTTLTSGAFVVTCYADNVVGLDTYTIKPVLEGAGSGGSSQYYTTDPTDTYIADRLAITLSADSYLAVNGTQVNITISVIYDYDSSSFTYYNLSMTRDAVFWYVFNHANSSLCNDTAADIEYTYTVNALNNETTHGITGFTSNNIDIEWAANVTTTTTTTGILYQLFIGLNMWGYLGPALLVIGGYFVARKDKILGIFYFIVECLVVAYYLDLITATPDYWWHIIIILLGGLFTCIYPLWDK